MAKALSADVRAKIVRHKQNGENNANISKWLLVCERSIERVWKRFSETGSFDALPQNSGRKPMVSDEIMQKIFDKIKQQPDETLQELVDEFDLNISISALCRKLQKSGLTYKKRRYFQAHKSAKT
jgi:transposase